MKENQYQNTIFSCIVLCVTALIFMTSCDTEYNTTYVSGDAYIKSFTIQAFENQQPIQAAIVNDTIKILWASYHDLPKTITPSIELADKAVISPKAAVEIPFKSGEKYTVTSEAGTSRQYTLQVDFRQPQPKTFALQGIYNKGVLGGWVFISDGSPSPSATDNLWFNLEQTRVYLVSAADQKTEYDCDIAYLGRGTGTDPFRSAGIYFYLPVNIAAGKYDLRIKNGEFVMRQSIEANRFNYELTVPAATEISIFTNTFTVAKGGTFTIRGTNLDAGTNVSIASLTTTERYPLEIISRTAYSATFKVPASIPAAQYRVIYFGETVQSFAATVTE